MVDVIFANVAQPDQARILLLNFYTIKKSVDIYQLRQAALIALWPQKLFMRTKFKDLERRNSVQLSK